MPTILTTTQAAQLGVLLRTHRNAKGLSLARLAAHIDMAESWLLDLEKGRVKSPGVAHLSRLMEALDVDAGTVNGITDGLLTRDLPGVRTYFRGREGLPSDAVSEVEAAVAEIRRRYGHPAPEPRTTPSPEDEDRSEENLSPPGFPEPRP